MGEKGCELSKSDGWLTTWLMLAERYTKHLTVCNNLQKNKKSTWRKVLKFLEYIVRELSKFNRLDFTSRETLFRPISLLIFWKHLEDFLKYSRKTISVLTIFNNPLFPQLIFINTLNYLIIQLLNEKLDEGKRGFGGFFHSFLFWGERTNGFLSRRAMRRGCQ